jgi:hypothetical protein
VTSAILTRFAVLFRAAGWLIAALGVIGLARSASSSRRTRFSTLSIGVAFDFLRQVVNAARPAVADFAGAPPWGTILLGLDSLIPRPAGSLIALGLGLCLHRFGAKS